ncbi:Diaminopimelate epimerase [bioreactor metagenome]|uniref:diaminopimelate epimerase n=1 Tax=bioreactor metagenome TaxID=1076179 RepID=A0A645H9V9_9ZZZZ
MRMYNADGSEGKMCGNGIRCLGKYVFEHQMTDKTSLTVETRGGIKTLDLIIENDQVAYVKVDMGKPELKAPNIPVICENDHFINQPVMVLGKEYAATAVSMGNPHCVIFLKNIESLNLKDIGPFFENQKIFPDRVNTEFAEVISPTLIKMRVWERGSGETQACGTGACAAAVAACLNGISKQGTDITVKLAGGDLNIRWEKDQTVYMKGPASFIFEGTITI